MNDIGIVRANFEQVQVLFDVLKDLSGSQVLRSEIRWSLELSELALQVTELSLNRAHRPSLTSVVIFEKQYSRCAQSQNIEASPMRARYSNVSGDCDATRAVSRT